MSLISKLGYSPKKIDLIKVDSEIIAKEISIIIPVKNNQQGIDKFLDTFFHITQKKYYPKEIIIVDNLSTNPIKIKDKYQEFNVLLTSC
jgi:glycosyltransferase involved in cell wall biosynthesis